jgi:ADP-heptose:LPS heptosyltransferase
LKKILIIRFSSIGDIVLTTPVIRCVRQQMEAEVHYVTKEAFRDVLAHNPYIHKIHTFKSNVTEVLKALKAEKFDVVIDLHRNIRTLHVKQYLRVKKTLVFNKINFQKFVAVRFKALGILPHKHIVDRFFDAIKPLHVTNDRKGLDYYIAPEDEINMPALFLRTGEVKYIALVVGGSYHTKKIPLGKLEQICRNARMPVILLGGPGDKDVAGKLKSMFPLIINGCGNFTINQSASVIKQAEWVITSDTGLMHIAAAYRKKIVSVWGNTIPDFGMSPYKPREENITIEIQHLKCRPCSKLGFKKCPQGHFRCMLDLDYEFVKELE